MLKTSLTYRQIGNRLIGQTVLPRAGFTTVTAESVKRLREELISEFIKAAGVQDLTKNGFRFVVDFRPRISDAKVYLFAGKDTPNINPQDWMISKPEKWEPAPKGSFYFLCAEAAAERSPRMKYGNSLLYPSEGSEVFGVMDGDPKSDIHFLMMTRKNFSSMLDPGFTTAHWNTYFWGAAEILNSMKAGEMYQRISANFGLGFQTAARVHMHVQAYPGEPTTVFVPPLFPEDIGLEVKPGGIIAAPATLPGNIRLYGNLMKQALLKLIDDRSKVKGSDSGSKAERSRLDRNIFELLRELEKISVKPDAK
ncbi:MAG: hypothetical protein NTZ10_01635 [Candidatus Saganbacteria bacterium]|nr:hypothetical protein [Candidatus Saganbacteria bacterium]